MTRPYAVVIHPSFRSLFTTPLMSAFFAVLFLSTPLFAAMPVVISSAVADADELLGYGTNFADSLPTVTLAGTPLSIVSFDSTVVAVQLPPNSAGTSELDVANGNNTSEPFEVTVGHTGPTGETGSQGATGAQGPEGLPSCDVRQRAHRLGRSIKGDTAMMSRRWLIQFTEPCVVE